MASIEPNTTALVSHVAPQARFIAVTDFVSRRRNAKPKKNISPSTRRREDRLRRISCGGDDNSGNRKRRDDRHELQVEPADLASLQIKVRPIITWQLDPRERTQRGGSPGGALLPRQARESRACHVDRVEQFEVPLHRERWRAEGLREHAAEPLINVIGRHHEIHDDPATRSQMGTGGLETIDRVNEIVQPHVRQGREPGHRIECSKDNQIVFLL